MVASPHPFDAYTGSDAFIFISYCHKDKNTVYPIIQKLHDTGARIWYDEGIPPSESWMKIIADKILKCSIFLVFLTPNAVISENVLDEIGFAKERWKQKDIQFFTIYLTETKLPAELQLSLNRIQALIKYEIPESDFFRKLSQIMNPTVFSAKIESIDSPSIGYTPYNSQHPPPPPPRIHEVARADQKLRDYYGTALVKEEYDVMIAFERILGTRILAVPILEWNTFGFVPHDAHVISLGFFGAGLNQLPSNIGNLTLLKNLNLYGNNLTALPDSFGNLNALQGLYIGENALNTLPESIGNLAALKELNAYGNHLIALPISIGKLPRLEHLSVHGNGLSMLPDSLTSIGSLQSLSLANNKIEVLPENIGILNRLEILGISNNRLKIIPESIGNLQSLTELDVSANQLTTLPRTIGKLTKLEVLILQLNPLGTLTAEIEKVLLKLDMQGCKISR